MTFEDYKYYLGKVPPYVDITIAGLSEPWLNPECTRMVEYTHRKGHQIIVFTTLVGITAEDIRVLQKIPFICFQVHLPSREGKENIPLNKAYFENLENISKSRIKVSYMSLGKCVLPEVKEFIRGPIHLGAVVSRAGNVTSSDVAVPVRRKGALACKVGMTWNILLPNGEVLLCCMDYGLNHVIGNLATSDYKSLFRSKEFLRVKSGQKNETEEILCRYCDFAYECGLDAKFLHFPISFLRIKIAMLRSDNKSIWETFVAFCRRLLKLIFYHRQ